MRRPSLVVPVLVLVGGAGATSWGCAGPHEGGVGAAPRSAAHPQSAEKGRGGELVAQSGPPAFVGRGSSAFGTDVLGLPTGAFLTPDAAPGAQLLELNPHLPFASAFRAGGAAAAALSPDGTTLLVLTSGFNRVYDPETGLAVPEASTEWVFVYDVTSGTPRETQVVAVPNAFGGLAFHPRGDRFYVSGGPDDTVCPFVRDATGRWSAEAPTKLGHLPDPHAHAWTGEGEGGIGVKQGPFAAGLALSASGKRLVVANHENDSISVLDLAGAGPLAEIALAPGGGKPGGEFPSNVCVVGEARAFVTSQRDREVVEVDLDAKRVVRRIKVGGQPTKLIANRAQTRLYVANANSDTVSVINVGRGEVEADIPTAATPGNAALAYRGSNPNAIALSPDEARLFVTNGGNNTVAILDLAKKSVVGLVPTGFYPTAVLVGKDGAHLFVAYAKSPAGPNALGPWSAPERARTKPYGPGRGNQYSLQLEHAGLLSFPVPSEPTLAKLTAQSIANNRFRSDAGIPPVFQALRGEVKHVIYVVGENRTYDQILGDVAGADGDPRLTLWGDAITPNHHALARSFVTLDRFFDPGGVSGEGWQWTTSGRTTDVAEKALPLEYAGRGKHTYDWEGGNRGINVSWPTLAERKNANPSTPDSIDVLPGSADVGAVDGPAEGGRGFLWDTVLASGKEVRNYGAFCDDSRFGLAANDPSFLPPLIDPFAMKVRVAFPTRGSLHDRTDPYFQPFDMNVADVRREAEWAREFDGFVQSGNLPALEVVRLPHDHLGSFGTALEGVDTPDTQIADNDYALGLLVEKVSRSPYWKDTVIVALEDDAQNGSDHVDAHRSFVLFAGGHVKRGGVISTAYATPSVLRTIELLLGAEPLGQADAFAPPMGEVLDAKVDPTPFVARVPAVLRTTKLPLPAASGALTAKPRGSATLWATLMQGQDFSKPDALDAERFNRALACGLVGGAGCVSRPGDAPAQVRAGDDDD
jgi:YVTN family beta-propeller protein